MLFSPRVKPDAEKYSKSSTDIDLLEEDISVVGPFNFAPPIGAAKSSSLVPREVWKALSEKCTEFGILPPALFNACTMMYTSASTMTFKLKRTNTVDLYSNVSSLHYTMVALLMNNKILRIHTHKVSKQQALCHGVRRLQY